MEIQGTYETACYNEKMMSDDIGKLAEALAKAQMEMSAAKKDAKNPFFKSDYATLASCLGAGNPALNKNGLSVTQLPGSSDGNISLETILMHTSGQFIKSNIYVKPEENRSTGAWCLPVLSSPVLLFCYYWPGNRRR